jgi:hypothetical protein
MGRVYVYKYPSTTPMWVLAGESDFDKFGFDLDMSNQMEQNVLAISAQSMTSQKINSPVKLHRAGVVLLYNISDSGRQPNLIATIKSDRGFSAFGSKLKVNVEAY